MKGITEERLREIIREEIEMSTKTPLSKKEYWFGHIVLPLAIAAIFGLMIYGTLGLLSGIVSFVAISLALFVAIHRHGPKPGDMVKK